MSTLLFQIPYFLNHIREVRSIIRFSIYHLNLTVYKLGCNNRKLRITTKGWVYTKRFLCFLDYL